MTEPRPGFKTTEFWFPITKYLGALALTFYEPTRPIGVALLGVGVRDAEKYIEARTELKRRAIAAKE